MKVGIEYNGMTIETDELILAGKGLDDKSFELQFKNGLKIAYLCVDMEERDLILSLIQEAACEHVNKRTP
jgi:hypothetical protein